MFEKEIFIMAFFNLFRRQIAPVSLVITTNINNVHRRFMSRLRKYYTMETAAAHSFHSRKK